MSGIAFTHRHTPAEGAVLKLQGIRKTFGQVVALKGVDLDIYPGEIHAIVGENGAGKSTLIGVAAGVVKATSGSVIVGGRDIARPNPIVMRQAGVAVAFQQPALPPHLSVLDCMALAMPALGKGSAREQVQRQLDRLAIGDLRVNATARVSGLSLAQRHLVEIARALASNPRVLVLDEPTEPFQDDTVQMLFDLLRELRGEGRALVYISHRLSEVQQIADRISVLRDGELIDSRLSKDFSHAEIIRSIVGRPMGQIFPSKAPAGAIGAECLCVRDLSGRGFSGVDFAVRAGEVVGLAGVEGQGQREFIRALAGIEPARTGELRIRNKEIDHSSRFRARRAGIGFVPGDRHEEGLFLSLSVEENLALARLEEFSAGGVLGSERVRQFAEAVASRLSVKASSLQAPLTTLSGGNQQKVLIGRELGTRPAVLLVDEPTAGVDIGSKSEIYHQLRDVANSGVAVVVSASDGVEIEGLCDRVVIFSRGSAVAELSGDEVTDERITATNLQASNRRDVAHSGQTLEPNGILSKLSGGYAPALILSVIVAALVAVTAAFNSAFLSAYNLGIVLTFLVGLAFISFGQQLVMVLGEVDLSLGPLAGLAVVLASYWIPDGASTTHVAIGAGKVVLATLAIGLVQGFAITFLDISAIVFTLGSFFGLQGLSLLLRPTPSGMINDKLGAFLGTPIGGIPVAAILMGIVVVVLELVLFRSRPGRVLRATGSDAAAAFKLGSNRRFMGPAAFAAAGLLAGLGGLVLASEVGIGSATVGANYTLMSITAVVLGGASIAGGWGSFVCTLFGALFVQMTFSMTSFLNLGSQWEYFLVGTVTLVSASLYRLARSR